MSNSKNLHTCFSQLCSLISVASQQRRTYFDFTVSWQLRFEAQRYKGKVYCGLMDLQSLNGTLRFPTSISLPAISFSVVIHNLQLITAAIRPHFSAPQWPILLCQRLLHFFQFQPDAADPTVHHPLLTSFPTLPRGLAFTPTLQSWGTVPCGWRLTKDVGGSNPDRQEKWERRSGASTASVPEQQRRRLRSTCDASSHTIWVAQHSSNSLNLGWN